MGRGLDRTEPEVCIKTPKGLGVLNGYEMLTVGGDGRSGGAEMPPALLENGMADWLKSLTGVFYAETFC